MSMGYGAAAELIQADDSQVIYAYSCFNLNMESSAIHQKTVDGMLLIDRSCVMEPEIRKKVMRSPSGRKCLETRRIIKDVPVGEFIAAKKVVIENASGTWRKAENGIDRDALQLLDKLFCEYQEDGEIPQEVCYYA